MRDDDGRADNARTVASSGEDDVPGVSLATLAQVYARVAQMVGLGAAHAEAPGYRLFWSTGGALGYTDVFAEPGSYVVLGRHAQCDARLDEDPRVSLRHLLASAVALEGGRVALRLVDLRGSVPFFLDDDVPQRGLVATGPLALRLGRYVVCAVPLGGKGASFARLDRPGTLPAYRIASASDAASAGDAWDDARPTHVTLRRGTTHVEDLDGPLRPGFARIVVTRGDRSATVELSEEDLAEGVLVGRSERCLDRGIGAVLSAHVSRAHLLVVANGDRVQAFDLCSTNGTQRDGRGVRWTVLADAGTELRLGRRVRLEWRRTAKR